MATKEKLETPLWDIKPWADDIYEPSEDSFLLMDALEEDLQFIRNLTPIYILEIGSGSGVVITSLAKVFKNSYCMAIDINYKACLATKTTGELNHAYVDVIRSDLVSGLRTEQLIDVLLFNPPYVPSKPEEEKDMIDKAWAGSTKGRFTTDRLFPILCDLMSNRCVGYIVAIEENDPDEMCHILETLGFKVCVVKKRTIIGEKLSVLRFTRDSLKC